MNDGTIGLVILVLICVLLATLMHWLIKTPKLASTLSAILAVVVFQIVAYIDLGYLDPFFLIAVVISAGIAFIISVLIGSLFKTNRDKNTNAQSKTT